MSAAQADERKTASSKGVRGVIELFTSQGCSNCPAADAVLARFAAKPNVVALAYHVDYWDYIGWQDTLGSRRNAERQKGYTKALRLGALTTPQAIINGDTALGGANEKEIADALRRSRLPGADGDPHVGLTLTGDTLRVEAKASFQDHPPVLILVTYSKETRTLVSRGENRGRHLVNIHAVRDWRAVGTLDAAGHLQVDMPIGLIADPDGHSGGSVALLQTMDEKDRPSRILAAAVLEFNQTEQVSSDR